MAFPLYTKLGAILGVAASAEGTFDRPVEVSTDSRSISEGALFVALDGDRFDGHAFLKMPLHPELRGLL